MGELPKQPRKSEPVTPYKARTPLGKRLSEARRHIVASGDRLLSRDEIEREVAERRGGHRGDRD